MNWIRKVTIGAVVLCALGAMAQQPSTMPSLDDHMKLLSTQLDLTPDQQAKIRPLVKEMQESAEKVKHDQSLSADQRHEKLKALHKKTLNDAKQYLTTEQQQKLNALAENPHPDQHGTAH